jgi:hypothetical protein
MQAGVYMKLYKCSDFKYCLFGAINTAYRVFMRVYNGLLPTANMASPKIVFQFRLQFHGKVSETFYRYILH